MSRVGLAIRTAYNNQGWANPCKNPKKDRCCYKCFRGALFINDGKILTEDENGYCKGNPTNYPLADITNAWCWEQVLCAKYIWGNVIGKWKDVYQGMPVYFTYVEVDNSYTIWGHSIVDRIDNSRDKYPPIYFKPFSPLPQDKWIKNLSDIDITGKPWRQLHYRYLDENHTKYISSLISEDVKRENIVKPLPVIEPYEKLEIELKGNIKQELEKISKEEGRDIQELVREAIAKLIKERKA
jgi:hypothetical protein